jgi:uncharacterized protein (TIGR02217 family)
MIPFVEIRFPARLAFGSTGVITRRTDIVALASGYETRATPWADGRRRYVIGEALRSLDDLATLQAFFEARRGPLQGFRFTDPVDHQSCAPSAAISPLDQPIGAGDGKTTVFALAKTYGGAGGYVRPIVKPVAGTVRIAVAGVELMASAFSLDATRGRVTLAAPPAAGAQVTAGFAFDTPVRFEEDHLEATFDSLTTARLTPTALIEVRV